jgi:hypothetical protein
MEKSREIKSKKRKEGERTGMVNKEIGGQTDRETDRGEARKRERQTDRVKECKKEEDRQTE